MAIHHRVSKGKIEAELQRLLRGETSARLPEPPPREPREDSQPSPDPRFSLIRELATTLLVALLLSLLLVSLKLSAPQFRLEMKGMEFLERFHLG